MFDMWFGLWLTGLAAGSGGGFPSNTIVDINGAGVIDINGAFVITSV